MRHTTLRWVGGKQGVAHVGGSPWGGAAVAFTLALFASDAAANCCKPVQVACAPAGFGPECPGEQILGSELDSVTDCVAAGLVFPDLFGAYAAAAAYCASLPTNSPCQPVVSNPEIFDGLDNSCNGFIDECPVGQGFWSCSPSACPTNPGTIPCGTTGITGTCTPTATQEAPGNGVDDDCDGLTDECEPIACVLPVDSPGCGPNTPGQQACLPDGSHGACAPTNAPNAEIPANGLDDNCDGFGIGDEFCDGADNDGNGHVDDDVGSCLVRMLAVPLCWDMQSHNGVSADDAFRAAVDEQKKTFIHAIGMDGCAHQVWFEAIPPSVLNVPCDESWYEEGDPSAPIGPLQIAVQAVVDGDPAMYGRFRPSDLDALFGLTTANLFGAARGATDRSGRFWSEATELETIEPGIISKYQGVATHEFGHVVGLADEYCSLDAEPESDGNSDCNSAASINRIQAVFGCDPTSESCCSVDFRYPDRASQFDPSTPCGGQYEICCLGNSSLVDPSKPLDQLVQSDLDPTGRCVMGSSIAPEPRTYCAACMTHIRTMQRPYACGVQYGGPSRLLVLKGTVDPNAARVVVLSAAEFNLHARAGLQNASPAAAGDVVLHFVAQDSGVYIASRGLDFPHYRTGEQLAESAEVELRIVLPDEVSETEPITVFVERNGMIVDQTTINGQAPVPVVADAPNECESALGAVVVLDAGDSFDADGDPFTFEWSAGNGVDLETSTPEAPVGLFPLGTTDVSLTVTDTAGLSTTVILEVLVADTTPPTFSLATLPKIDATTCSAGTPDIALTIPQATDACGVVTVTGVVNNTPITPGASNVLLSPGDQTILWTASDGVNARSVSQAVAVLPALFAGSILDVRDGARVRDGAGRGALIANRGTQYSRLGAAPAEIGSLFSRASVESFGGTIRGNVYTQGSYTPRNGAQVTGTVFAGQAISLPPMPGAVTSPTNGQNVVVNSARIVLAPGTYGDVIINSGAPNPALELSPGTYRFKSLTSNSQTSIRVTGTAQQRVNVLVSSSLNYRGSFLRTTGELATVFLGFGGTSTVIEGPFQGTLVAPNSIIELGLGASTNMRGQFAAKELRVRPQTPVTCLPSSVLGSTFQYP